jgi:hypothetical protein
LIAVPPWAIFCSNAGAFNQPFEFAAIDFLSVGISDKEIEGWR